MNYWATDDDPHFAAGHYVEDWEIERLAALSAPVRELLRIEASAGNKITHISERFIKLEKPLGLRVDTLPEGIVFWTPLRDAEPRFWDGDESGVVQCLASRTRIHPTIWDVDPEDA
jgi:hypothetical protein